MGLRKEDHGPQNDGPWLKALNNLKRGQVVVVNLTGAQGHELRKIRPAVVLSNDDRNRAADTVIVVPLGTHSGSGKVGDHEVALEAGEGELGSPGVALPLQVRSIDHHARVTELLGVLSGDSMLRIENTLFATCGSL